jgi:exosome complex component CSL4
MTADLPKLRYETGSTVVPGDRLGNIRQVASGEGTYVSKGHIYACLVGAVTVTPAANNENSDESSSVPSFECSVTPRKMPFSSQALLVGQLVVGKIARITPQNAILEISLAEHVGPLHTRQEGAIRMEDIRSGATAQILLGDCFQPGDLVVARVISLGDSRRYFLSTAEPELGVIRAKRRNGATLIPISWKEMECPETGVKESRKCAKPMISNKFQTSK